MRYYVSLALLAVVLSACNPAPPHQDTAMSASASTPIKTGVKTGTGMGVVTAVDVKAGTVTIDHQPMPSIGWPAMTMRFPVADRHLLDGIHVRDTVTFDVTVTDNKPVITGLRK